MSEEEYAAELRYQRELGCAQVAARLAQLACDVLVPGVQVELIDCLREEGVVRFRIHGIPAGGYDAAAELSDGYLRQLVNRVVL